MVDILNTVEYKFADFTEKDMFEIKLKGVVPEFEYISCTKRHPFTMFCINAGFIEFVDAAHQHDAYKVMHEFVYSTMGDYRPMKMYMKVNDYMMLDKHHRQQRFTDFRSASCVVQKTKIPSSVK